MFRECLRDGRGIVVAFLFVGASVAAAYVHLTPYDARTHDLGGHLAYVDYVAERHRIPPASACWQCHHPPAYYVLAAAVLSLANHGEPPPAAKDEIGCAALAAADATTLQRMHALIAVATLACFLLAIRAALRSTYERVLASALATFWPTLTIHACRIGNEALFYLFTGAALWQVVSWRRSGRAHSLVFAAIAAGLALHAKATGVVPVLVVVASVALAILRPREGRARWPAGGVPALSALACLVALWAATVAWIKGGAISKPAQDVGNDLLVPDTWRAFVTFDPRSFSEDPFADVHHGHGRSQFWNYLFRTSLFGEFSSDDAHTRAVGFALAGLAAALLPLAVAGLAMHVARSLRRHDEGTREIALAAIGFLAMEIVLRARWPYVCLNDFRFIVPVAMCGAITCAWAAARMRRTLSRGWPHLAALPAWLVVGFCAASARIVLVWP